MDTAIHDQLFWGVYSTFKPSEGHVIDAYGLVLDDSRDLYASEIGPKGDLERRTFGLRYDYRGEGGWLAETEWALQRGTFGDDRIFDFDTGSAARPDRQRPRPVRGPGPPHPPGA